MEQDPYAFETERLRVAGWHSLLDDEALAIAVAGMLTPAVTASLPEDWHGSYSRERAAAWIAEHDAEATVLLVQEKSSESPAGLLILHEEPLDEERVELRLGYLLAEAFWGIGLASELIGGLVAWADGQERVASLVGGVAPENVASRRVLEKNGFRRVEGANEGGEDLFSLRIR